MKVGELIRRLSVFHDNTEVVIHTDMPVGYPLKIEAIYEGYSDGLAYIDVEADMDEDE